MQRRRDAEGCGCRNWRLKKRRRAGWTRQRSGMHPDRQLLDPPGLAGKGRNRACRLPEDNKASPVHHDQGGFCCQVEIRCVGVTPVLCDPGPLWNFPDSPLMRFFGKKASCRDAGTQRVWPSELAAKEKVAGLIVAATVMDASRLPATGSAWVGRQRRR